jgi:hypothetical protein
MRYEEVFGFWELRGGGEEAGEWAHHALRGRLWRVLRARGEFRADQGLGVKIGFRVGFAERTTCTT